MLQFLLVDIPNILKSISDFTFHIDKYQFWTAFFYLVDKNLLLSGITNTGGNREVACKGHCKGHGFG